MFKKYRIVSIGENDSYHYDEKQLVGLELVARPSSVGTFYDGALSGRPIFGLCLNNDDVWDGDVRCFHEAYVEEI